MVKREKEKEGGKKEGKVGKRREEVEKKKKGKKKKRNIKNRRTVAGASMPGTVSCHDKAREQAVSSNFLFSYISRRVAWPALW